MSDTSIFTDASPSFQGGASASNTTIKLQIDDKDVGLAQSVKTTMSRQVKHLYELGTYNYFPIIGYPTGSGSVNYILQNTDNKDNIITVNSLNRNNNCDTSDLYIYIETICSVDKPSTVLKYRYTGGIVQSLTSSLSVNDWFITEELAFTFANVELTTDDD